MHPPTQKRESVEASTDPKDRVGGCILRLYFLTDSLEHEMPGPNPFGGGQTCLVPTKQVWWGPNPFDKAKIANMCLKMWGLI